MDVSYLWADAVKRPAEDVELDRAALLISAAVARDVDVEAQLRRLDDLAAGVRQPTTGGVARLMFGEIGLAGDRRSYDDPVNSYLDRVLDRRLGIPISLSVLMIEVARRRGVHLEPVGMPGHFLVRDPSRPGELIDAFDGGRRLDRDGCEAILRSVAGAGARLEPDMVAATPVHAVLARMLANLDRSLDQRGDRSALAAITELRLLLPGAPAADRGQLAGRLASLGRFGAAAAVLEQAAAASPHDRARNRMLAEAAGLRARLN